MIRFRASSNPIGAIGYYLSEIVAEAKKRKYVFDASKIEHIDMTAHIPVTNGQILYEQKHLEHKLLVRDPERILLLQNSPILTHSIFSIIEGEVESWEKI